MLRSRGVQSTVTSSTVPSALSKTICTIGPSAFITARIASSSITVSGPSGCAWALEDEEEEELASFPGSDDITEESWFPIYNTDFLDVRAIRARQKTDGIKLSHVIKKEPLMKKQNSSAHKIYL